MRFSFRPLPLLALVAPFGAAADRAGDPFDPFPGAYVDGFLDVRYTYRGTSASSDNDLDEYLSLSFGERGRERVRGYVSGRLAQDLDGFDAADPFASIPGTHGRSYERLCEAYLELMPGWAPLESARLGRQWLSEVPEIARFDGARVSSAPLEPLLGTRLIAFAGLPDHLEESSPSGDLIAGGGIEVRPIPRGRIAASYAHIRDDYESDWAGSSARDVYRDDLVSVELRQSALDDLLQLFAGYTNLNGESRDVRLNLSCDAGRTTAGARFRALFSTQESLSTELDPYASVLRSYHPYWEIGAWVRHEFSETIGAEAGFDLRRLRRVEDIGPFNHEFERYFVAATVRGWPLSGSDLSAIGELYETGSDRTVHVGGSFRQELLDRLRAEIGTAYALYREDRFTFEERDDVRIAYARCEYDLLDFLSLRCGYAIEDDDERTTHVVEIGARVKF